MEPTGASLYRPAYKWLSLLAIVVFILYWGNTIAVTYGRKEIGTLSPRYMAVNRLFWRQGWRLFVYTSLYNRQLNVVVRNSNDTTVTDTTNVVQYLLAQKRKYAPFNNYVEAVERVLYNNLNMIRARVKQDTAMLKKKYPGRPEEFYITEAARLIQADPFVAKELHNMDTLARKVLQEQKTDTAGKEYKLLIIHKYIPPQMPPPGPFSTGDIEVIFQTGYKKF